MSNHNGIAHNHGTHRTLIALSHLQGFTPEIKGLFDARLQIVEVSGCKYVVLHEVFELLKAELLEAEGAK